MQCTSSAEAIPLSIYPCLLLDPSRSTADPQARTTFCGQRINDHQRMLLRRSAGHIPETLRMAYAMCNRHFQWHRLTSLGYVAGSYSRKLCLSESRPHSHGPIASAISTFPPLPVPRLTAWRITSGFSAARNGAADGEFCLLQK